MPMIRLARGRASSRCDLVRRRARTAPACRRASSTSALDQAGAQRRDGLARRAFQRGARASASSARGLAPRSVASASSAARALPGRAQPRAPRVQLAGLDRQRLLAPAQAMRAAVGQLRLALQRLRLVGRAGGQRLLARRQLGGAQDLRLLGAWAASAIARVTLRHAAGPGLGLRVAP